MLRSSLLPIHVSNFIYVLIEIIAILFIVYVVKCDSYRQGPRTNK